MSNAVQCDQCKTAVATPQVTGPFGTQSVFPDGWIVIQAIATGGMPTAPPKHFCTWQCVEQYAHAGAIVSGAESA